MRISDCSSDVCSSDLPGSSDWRFHPEKLLYGGFPLYTAAKDRFYQCRALQQQQHPIDEDQLFEPLSIAAKKNVIVGRIVPIDAIEFFFINSVNTACVSDYAIADGLSVGQLVTDFAARFPHTSLRSDYRPPESSVVEIELNLVQIVQDAHLLLAEQIAYASPCSYAPPTPLDEH